MTDLKPCPYCGGAMRIEGNRDTHKLLGAHDENCTFDANYHMVQVPATDEQLQLMVSEWNRCATEAEAAGKQGISVPWDRFPSWRIDHCEGDTITLADMLAAPSATFDVAASGEAVAEVEAGKFGNRLMWTTEEAQTLTHIQITAISMTQDNDPNALAKALTDGLRDLSRDLEDRGDKGSEYSRARSLEDRIGSFQPIAGDLDRAEQLLAKHGYYIAMPSVPPMWRRFDPASEWIGGAVIWLWAPSWEKPRLAVASMEDAGTWEYEASGIVGAGSEEFPTHCSRPRPPGPPMNG